MTLDLQCTFFFSQDIKNMSNNEITLSKQPEIRLNQNYKFIQEDTIKTLP